MPTILKLHEPAHHATIVSHIRSHRILWLDVEKREKDAQPAMVGYIPYGSVLSKVQQVMCDLPFVLVADMKKIEHMHWFRFVLDVVVPVIKADGLVAAYSAHELKYIVGVLEALNLYELVDRLQYLDCNAGDCFRQNLPAEYSQIRRRLMRRYRRGLISRRPKVGLKDYLMSDASGYDYPKYLRGFSPAEALAYIRPQAIDRPPRRWTKGAKRRLTNLLTYNAHDVSGMRYLTMELMGMPLVDLN